VELLGVMTSVSVVSTVVVLEVLKAPDYISAIRSARESVLKEDLQAMRNGIRSYTADKKKRPRSLKDLKEAGYVKQIPEDPMTRSNETWTPQIATAQTGSGGIDDVHSGSHEQGSNGRLYSTW
jgi:general secretion pathway protein G